MLQYQYLAIFMTPKYKIVNNLLNNMHYQVHGI